MPRDDVDDQPDQPTESPAGKISAQQVLAELLASSQRQEAALAQGLESLRADLDMLWQRVDALGGAAPQQPPPAPPVEQPTVEEPAEPPPIRAETVEPEPEPAPIVTEQPAAATRLDDTQWEHVILGRDLVNNPALADDRAKMMHGLWQGDGEATALVGQLLSFRAAPPEKKPPMLREVGEAYYRWRGAVGQGDDPLRDALLEWIVGVCDDCGIGNRIELVRVGDRYDATRHNAKQPGGEVIEVFGWVVLRDNGRVYTKASVAAG